MDRGWIVLPRFEFVRQQFGDQELQRLIERAARFLVGCQQFLHVAQHGRIGTNRSQKRGADLPILDCQSR
jgi:hypothetical protein